MITLRNAITHDALALAEVGQAAFWDAYGGTASDDDIAAHVERYFGVDAIRREMALPRVTYLVASEADDCAGLVKILDGSPPECVDADTAVEVQQIYVSTRFQRRGVGGLLMDSTVAHARERLVDGIWLSVWSEADWAIAFYEKYGFREMGTADFELGSEVHLDHIMWLPIDRA